MFKFCCEDCGECWYVGNTRTCKCPNEELQQPKQEQVKPVAWMVWGHDNVPSLTFTKPADKYVFDSLYMIPPQRTWVGLTDEEIDKIRNTPMSVDGGVGFSIYSYARAIEAKLKERNT